MSTNPPPTPTSSPAKLLSNEDESTVADDSSKMTIPQDNLNDNSSQSSSSSTSTSTLKAPEDNDDDDIRMSQMVKNLQIKDSAEAIITSLETSKNLNTSVINNATINKFSAAKSDSNSGSTQESNLKDIITSSGNKTALQGKPQNLTTLKSSPPPSNQEYHLKWIKWKGCPGSGSSNSTGAGVNAQQQQNKVPIVTQNSNGSCPLLAIINVLLLRKNITFPPIIEIVTASQLMDYLCDCIMTYVPKNLPEQVKLNYEQNFQDAMSIMPRLQTGLDVNVKFTGTMDFEYTPECIIFDLLRIPLYHGWLVDPNHKEISRIVNNQSYNQLVDRIIASKASNLNDSEMFLAEEFLNQTASQLTNYGLSQLIKHIKEEELCILFRNNHFITLFKHKGKLYQLVTDQGFLTEPNVVWESLNNIEGDTYFVDGDFVLVPPKPHLSMQPTPNINTQQQIDQDYLIALSLEQEQNYEAENSTRTGSGDSSTLVIPKSELAGMATTTDSSILMSDEELARKLQEEENQYYEQQQKQQRQHKQDTLIKTSHSGTVGKTTTKSGPLAQTGNCLKTDSSAETNPAPRWSSYAAAAASGTTTATSSTGMHHPHSHHHQPTSRSISLSSSTTSQQHSIGHNRSSSHSHGSGSSSSTHPSLYSSHHQSQHQHISHHNSSRPESSGGESPTAGEMPSPGDRESASSQKKSNKNSCTIT